MTAIGPCQPHSTDRFGRRATVGPGHATDCHGKTRTAGRLGAANHGFDHLPADCTDLGEQRFGDPKLASLLSVGVGDIAGLEPGGAARYAGDGFGDAAAGAGFGGGDLGAEAAQVFAQPGGENGDRVHGQLLEEAERHPSI
ncbi:hypothetical protein D3C73_1205680 [compost metagenome]